MARLRVHNFSISLDGFAAGPDQDLENPMGVGAMRLHDWVFATATGKKMIGIEDDLPGDDISDRFMRLGTENIGATIMGRNMFGPIRDEWPDADWTGWWGEEPPFHHPVFVLTHHERESFEMAGGTSFTFVTDGIESALAQATEAAGEQDIRLGGGTATLQQYLRAGLVDDLHLAIAPVFLGRGERLFPDGLMGPDGFECVEMVSTGLVSHVRLRKA